MQKDDAPEQQRVGANCRRSKLNDLKAKKSTAVPGHHCLMLAVSTLRLDSIPKEGAGAPYDHTKEVGQNRLRGSSK